MPLLEQRPANTTNDSPSPRSSYLTNETSHNNSTMALLNSSNNSNPLNSTGDSLMINLNDDQNVRTNKRSDSPRIINEQTADNININNTTQNSNLFSTITLSNISNFLNLTNNNNITEIKSKMLPFLSTFNSIKIVFYFSLLSDLFQIGFLIYICVNFIDEKSKEGIIFNFVVYALKVLSLLAGILPLAFEKKIKVILEEYMNSSQTTPRSQLLSNYNPSGIAEEREVEVPESPADPTEAIHNNRIDQIHTEPRSTSTRSTRIRNSEPTEKSQKLKKYPLYLPYNFFIIVNIIGCLLLLAIIVIYCIYYSKIQEYSQAFIELSHFEVGMILFGLIVWKILDWVGLLIVIEHCLFVKLYC